MSRNSDWNKPVDPGDAAYLILRDELKWRNVFRLTSGQVTTVGRAPTNRVVVPDDICSRHHCEVFQTKGEWILRDLGSRNGTLIDGNRVTEDWNLTEGDQVQIGEFYLVFTYEISKAGEDPTGGLDDGTDTYDGTATIDSSSPEILYRRNRTRFHPGADADIGRDRTSQELADLYKLALEMGSANDSRQLADIVLQGLFENVRVDIGAILLLGENKKPRPDELAITVYRTREDAEDKAYEKVSSSLSSIVLTNQEAVLVRDIKDDSRLSETGSLEKLQARSVICAPIRTPDNVHGLVHLYTTKGNRVLGVEDLEYTLAVADQFALALENLQQREQLKDGLAKARDEAEGLRNQLGIESELVGNSPAMQSLKELIGRIAPTDATVLIRGESGVGKELVSRAIHFGSDRRNGPFVCMNCAALSETLLESELFGHEKGSFTGAVGRKIGKFEQANRGTLFLDEVGEMSLSIQAKFLRVLEGHPFERVGGGSQIPVDVRVLAATNRDLEKAIEEKKFRQDLFYRLFVVEVAIPNLRDHATDVPLLANHFLNRFIERTGREITGFSEEAMELLLGYEWPGNVRELQNTIDRAVILTRNIQVEVEDIQLSTQTATAANGKEPEIKAANRDITLERLEREHILATLERTSWNKSMAAQILGIERSTLDRKLKRYNVSRPPKGRRDK
ncbi:MAG: sigma 54-interacting transcriptional regulator [Planctomycetes bacterium]|nr:sigma 54-interacting transcriptional regulator [Planctomycetota bacterium]